MLFTCLVVYLSSCLSINLFITLKSPIMSISTSMSTSMSFAKTVSEVSKVVTDHISETITCIESWPFDMLSNICYDYLGKYSLNTDYNSNSEPEYNARKRAKYIDTESDNMPKIIIMVSAEKYKNSYYSFGRSFLTNKSSTTGLSPVDYMKHRTRLCIADNVSDYINNLDNNELHQYCLDKNNDTIANITMEYIYTIASVQKIKTEMLKRGWDLEIKNITKKYKTRIYRDGPIDTSEKTLQHWYLVPI